VDELCVLFPQAERSVLEAVLETEGSFDAAVEALLQSVVSATSLDPIQSSLNIMQRSVCGSGVRGERRQALG